MTKRIDATRIPTFCVFKVTSPERSDFSLSTNIPHSELNAFHGIHCLHVEANGGYRVNALAQLYFVKDAGFAWKEKNK